jgi:hypothetical protein
MTVKSHPCAKNAQERGPGFIAGLTVIVICYRRLLTACTHVAIIASVEATR